MKKILVFILGLFVWVFSYGQIYTSVKYLDKFDDVVKEQTIKTIVEKTDSTFTIETKGKPANTYYILNILEYGCAGDKDNIVNLVANVYGYQTCWCVVRSDMIDEYAELYFDVIKNCLIISLNEELTDDEKEALKNSEFSKLEKYYLFITHRVITSQYTHEYKSEYFWIQDEMNTKLGKDISRIVYVR